MVYHSQAPPGFHVAWEEPGNEASCMYVCRYDTTVSILVEVANEAD